MTVTEFNTKYEQYLEKGHYGLDIDVPAVIKFLDELFDEYLTKIDGFIYSQIKMKFGNARFYFSVDADSSDYNTNEALQFLVENTINYLIVVEK